MKSTVKKKHSLFVTFEGIDGCGKTTQLGRTYKLLTDMGYKTARLREPGSTPVTERIRKILLNPNLSINDTTELLLYEAARSEIVSNEIAPLLKSGHIVLCDRFYDSTTAYQGYGRQLDIKMIKKLHRIAVGNCHPDLTLVFDVDIHTALSRLKGNRDRLESQSAAFFNRVRRGFIEIAASEKKRVKLIDGTASPDEIFEKVRHLITNRLC